MSRCYRSATTKRALSRMFQSMERLTAGRAGLVPLAFRARVNPPRAPTSACTSIRGGARMGFAQ